MDDERSVSAATQSHRATEGIYVTHARTVTVQQVRVWIFSEIAAFLSHLRVRMRTPYSSCRAEFLMWDACRYVRQFGMHMWLVVTAHAHHGGCWTHSSELAAVCKQSAMKTLVGVALQLHSFWTWKLNWGEHWASRPIRFTTCIQSIGAWVGPGAGLDSFKRRIFCLCHSSPVQMTLSL